MKKVANSHRYLSVVASSPVVLPCCLLLASNIGRPGNQKGETRRKVTVRGMRKQRVVPGWFVKHGATEQGKNYDAELTHTSEVKRQREHEILEALCPNRYKLPCFENFF